MHQPQRLLKAGSCCFNISHISRKVRSVRNIKESPLFSLNEISAGASYPFFDVFSQSPSCPFIKWKFIPFSFFFLVIGGWKFFFPLAHLPLHKVEKRIFRILKLYLVRAWKQWFPPFYPLIQNIQFPKHISRGESRLKVENKRESQG